MTLLAHPTPLRFAARDHAAVTGRNLRRMLRSPDALLMGLALPVLLLVLFVYVFGGAIDTGTDYLNYVVPGIVLLSASFGAALTAVAVASDMHRGIVDRFRSMPIARSAVLTAHVVASLVRNLASTVVVFVVAALMGFRPDAHLVEWVAATGVIALFVLAISAVSAALGMLAGNDEAASGFTFLLLFLPYVSSAFVPPETMPGWLRGFAEHQPVTPVIETVRGLLTGTGIGSSAIVAIGWCAAFTAIGLVAATALFRQRTAR
ncbi:ABC transporter permease [Rhodococcus pyridinivorans]|uniref:ABC transporter permease n=1 Tax=Rhodococcus pyridinivorans TaxID=103816 RepID=UPI0020C63C4A|nr:ABC transporter permease [Rhodococcus pyridinivorans]UTM38746.1 ABC transporter permease [Rhodococcus pyridinivorans]